MKHLDKPIHFYTYTCVEARALFFFFNSKYINTEYRNFKRHQTMLVQFQPPRKYTIIGKNLISPIQGQYYLHSWIKVWYFLFKNVFLTTLKLQLLLVCKNLFHNTGPYAQLRISRNFNLRIQNKLIISTFYEWLKCVVQCFGPEKKKIRKH